MLATIDGAYTTPPLITHSSCTGSEVLLKCTSGTQAGLAYLREFSALAIWALARSNREFVFRLCGSISL